MAVWVNATFDILNDNDTFFLCIFKFLTVWRYIANNDTFIYLWHASTKIGGVCKSDNFYPWHVSTIFVAIWGNASFVILNDKIHLFIYDMHLQKLVMCVNLRIFILTCIFKFFTVSIYIANNDTFIYLWHASTKIGNDCKS